MKKINYYPVSVNCSKWSWREIFETSLTILLAAVLMPFSKLLKKELKPISFERESI